MDHLMCQFTAPVETHPPWFTGMLDLGKLSSRLYLAGGCRPPSGTPFNGLIVRSPNSLKMALNAELVSHSPAVLLFPNVCGRVFATL